MGCACGKPSYVSLGHLKGECEDCFQRLLIQRILKELRGFKRGERVLIAKGGPAAVHLLQKALAEMPVPIEIVQEPPADKALSIDIADTLIVQFLDEIMNGKPMAKDAPETLKPLRMITKEELVEYAKLHAIPVNFQVSDTQQFIDELQAKYPSTKFAALKSMEELK